MTIKVYGFFCWGSFMKDDRIIERLQVESEDFLHPTCTHSENFNELSRKRYGREEQEL